MYIFFGEKGEMVGYIIGSIGFLLALICFILYCKEYHYNTEKLSKNRAAQIEQKCAALREKLQENEQKYAELERSRQELEKQRLVEQDRAREARDATERLIEAEHQRAAAWKKIEQERMDRELALKEHQLAQQFNFKKQQFTDDFEVLMDAYDDELAAARAEVVDFQNKRAAINEAIAREKEITEREAFYSIDVSPNDQEDITLLQSMDLRLHNRDVIPKLVWELFIRRPTTEMIKRVTGGKKIGGIYKITFKKTGESYIGKTVDFATRWQNHVKTAIGLDGAARATLHNRMAKDGLWNYTFEILEEVDKDHLSARESYYIDLYGTKTQLNMKAGDKQ